MLEEGRDISTNFTCHAWSQSTGNILVCTDKGQMLLCANNGEYKSFVLQSPRPHAIDSVFSFSRGFIVGVEGSFYIFKDDEGDERALLVQDGERFYIQIRNNQGVAQTGGSPQLSLNTREENTKILAITVNDEEDTVYVTTSNGQLVKGQIDIWREEERKTVQHAFEHVIGPFHKDEITGLDVCVRKELLVTCSKDKSVSIWNYATKTHEVSNSFQEECQAVAFHPSGLHLIVALTDKIQLCNVLTSSITPYQMITVKNCSEVRFANGGHLFACAAKTEIDVYNFYTGESPQYMQFHGHHVNKVTSIDWFENDQGFTSCGHDGNIYFYDQLF